MTRMTVWMGALALTVVGCKLTSSGSTMGPSSSSSSSSSSSASSASSDSTSDSSSSGASKPVVMPDLFLMTQADAEAALKRAGFERAPTLDTSICGYAVDGHIVELGRVCYQHPGAGNKTGSKLPVVLRVQTENPLEGEIVQGRRYLMMPDLTGVHVDKARETLTEKGFTGEVKVTESDDPGCKPNIVCRTTPERQTRTEPSSTKLLYVGR